MNRCDNVKVAAGASSNAPEDDGYAEFLQLLQSPSPGQMTVVPVDAPAKEEPVVGSGDDSNVATKQEDDPTHPSSGCDAGASSNSSDDDGYAEFLLFLQSPSPGQMKTAVLVDEPVDVTDKEELAAVSDDDSKGAMKQEDDPTHPSTSSSQDELVSLSHDEQPNGKGGPQDNLVKFAIVPQDCSDTDSDSDTEGEKYETQSKFNASNKVVADSEEENDCNGQNISIENNNGVESDEKISVYDANGSPNFVPLWKVNIVGVLFGFIVCLNATSPHYSVFAPTQPLFNLPPHVIGQIDSDLVAIEIDKNDKIDAVELHNLLEKHDTIFTDYEIVELSEIFYASHGTGGMPMNDFLVTLDSLSFREKRARHETNHHIGTGVNEIS